MCAQQALPQGEPEAKIDYWLIIPALSCQSLLSDTDTSCHWCVTMARAGRSAVVHLGLGLGLGLEIR